MSELTCIPSTIESGTSLEYFRTFSLYPADDGWTAKLFLVGRTQKVVDAVPDGARHKFPLTAAITAALGAGGCKWTERAYKGEDVKTVERGSIEITPDPATLLGDQRPKEEIWLEAIEAKIGGRLTKDQESIQIDGIAIVHIPIERCFEIRTWLQAAIAQSRGGGMPATIQIRLTGAR